METERSPFPQLLHPRHKQPRPPVPTPSAMPDTGVSGTDAG